MATEEEENVITAVGMYWLILIEKKRLENSRRWAVNPINQNRRERGAYSTLVQELGL